MGAKLFNRDGQKWFQLKNGESFTVPDVKSITGMASLSTGLAAGVGDTKAATVGGSLVMAFNDGAGGEIAAASGRDMPCIAINPGDKIELSAVVANKSTVSITPLGGVKTDVWVIDGITTTGGVQGFYA
jgi:hypothetical protein